MSEIFMDHGELFMPVEERVVVFVGEGAIEPTGAYSLAELVAASDENQKPVEDPHVVCIDERRADGEKQPVREKLAGGNLATATFAAAAADWSLLTDEVKAAGPEAVVDEVADHLVGAGESLGAHIHVTDEPTDATGCGAVDKSGRTTVNIVEQGNTEVFVAQGHTDLGEHFNADHWQRAVDGYERIMHDPKWQNWRTAKIQDAVRERGGVVEALDGRNNPDRPDPENKRKNHWGEFARINPRAGYSNDRDEARIPGFQADLAALVRTFQAMAHSEEEFSVMLHAGALFQYGTAYTLTRNMNVVR